MAQYTLDTRLPTVIGGRTAEAFEKALGMETIRDLLWHVPRRYMGHGELTRLSELPVGEHVTVLARVLDVRERSMRARRGKILEARITDGVGDAQLTFFNQPWRVKELLPGALGIFAGKVTVYRGALQLQHPDYELFPEGRGTGDEAAAAIAFAERPVPIYPASARTPSWRISAAVKQVLHVLDPVEDPLPREIREAAGIIALHPALELVHVPEREEDYHRARKSLRFREAFDMQLALLERRRRAGIVAAVPRPRLADGLLAEFDETLPFELTDGQRAAGETISRELSEPHPMHRLLQGEVGSGKTLVALRAMLQVAEHGGQSALLAPTEVLAAQHYRSITDTLGEAFTERLKPVLITSRLPSAQKRRALLEAAAGGAKIVIGTHALLSDQTEFFDLGLVVIDEQHRFGVEQRETLRLKGNEPHTLAMTATPIPRTVALTAFGDLEVTTIRDLPPGRQPVETFAVPLLERPAWGERAWQRALEEIGRGRQVYVVCPAISAGEPEEGEALPEEEGERPRPLASVEQMVADLSARPDYADVRIAPLTGAMSTDEKDRTMRSFAAGDIDMLVATTVIEVGVNVPNASVMIVLDADRFGVSQLHQLRGRVGRGEFPGLCLLLTTAVPGSPARARLDAVARTRDGFELADVDLELRREGDVLGTVQSGSRSTLRLLRVAKHGDLIARARMAASELLDRDPELRSAPLLAHALAQDESERRFENLSKS